jgi:replication initiation protein RepC
MAVVQTGKDRETPCSANDKWCLLDALTEASDAFELNHRTLSVLKALMSFHPGRAIVAEPGQAIVFPSNKTLSQRLNGIPESTLRRHLARLVELGFINRYDSANRKRFARNLGGARAHAFGFDLAPLAIYADQLFQAAEEARLAQQERAILRDRILVLRQELIEADMLTPALADDLRRLLRQKPCVVALENMLNKLVDLTATTDEMSATDTQNERHIQPKQKKSFDSEQPASSISLDKLLNLCPGFCDLFAAKPSTWSELSHMTNALGKMMGIDLPVVEEARSTMGDQDASMALLCMLERQSQIKSPGAYLRHLAKKAKAAQFSLTPMLKALGRSQSAKTTAVS